mgnify:CR=1 FL=1
MRFSTKLGIAAVLTGAALEAGAAGIALRLKAPTEGPAANDFTPLQEAAISINLLSRVSLATGIIALLYTAYKHLRHEPDANLAIEVPAISAAAPRQRLSLGAEFFLELFISLHIIIQNTHIKSFDGMMRHARSNSSQTYYA